MEGDGMTTRTQRIRELQYRARTELRPERAHALLLEIADLMTAVESPLMMEGPTTEDQPALFDFDGSDYEAEHDQGRLSGQIKRIFDLMIDGRWRTLREIQGRTDDGEASISAQLRNLRKPEFGRHTVEKRRRGDPKTGLWEYRLTRGE
jgi:hypothetical protein